MRHVFLFCALAVLPQGAAAATFTAAPVVPEARVDVVNRGTAREQLDRDLFAEPFATVVLAHVDIYDGFPYLESRTFQIVSDPEWNRLLAGEVGRGLVAFDGRGTPVGPLREPRGLALGPGGTVYVADAGNHRVLVLDAASTFDRLELTPVGEITGLSRPYGVAYSDRGTPGDPSDDRLYVSEAGANRISSYAVGERDMPRVSRIGELGSGPGRFAGPLALAVAGDDVVVADAHNGRLVRLHDDGAALRWAGEAAHDAGPLTSLDVDRWGNLYGAGPQSRRIVKFSPDLVRVADLDESLDQPRDVHVLVSDVTDHRSGAVFRRREPRAVSLERWSATSGIRLWNLGVDVRELAYDQGAAFLLTDRARVTATVTDGSTGETRTVDGGLLDAGRHTVALGAVPAGARIDIEARSPYEDGPVAHAALTLSGGSGVVRPILLGATPNPFQTSTRIHFEVPGEARPTRLRVFDVQGRAVATLADGVMGPGPVEIPWDGRDAGGVPVGAGLYFYQLTVGGQSFTAKLLHVQ